VAAAALGAVVAVACGKSGPPLPPLVKLPVAPVDIVAERRGGRVDLRFTVPTANTDNSRPANLSRVDVYAVTGTAQLTDDQWVKYGIKVDSVAVKAPRDPNATIDEDEPDADMEAPEGLGLDQGAVATLSERLTSASLVPFDVSKLPRVGAPPPRVSQDGPLL